MGRVGRDIAASDVARAAEEVRSSGFAILDGVLEDELVADVRRGLYLAWERVVDDVGEDRLRRAGELGVIRLPMRYDPSFYRLLGHPAIVALVDELLAPTAILHLQNGFVLPSARSEARENVFQFTYHMDFPRVLNGYVASLNVMVAIDEFSAANGGTMVCPGTQQRVEPPARKELEGAAAAVECAAGSLLVFDSTLWHAAGTNRSGRDRLAVNHQFTRSWIKPQIDYVRALGDEAVLGQPPRVQQLLGWYTRVVTSLDEYYRPADQRLYRSGQG
jgi:ectoine hydroxylase-related dioxygenase (phytanoyl-CoA dioxygenase family)